MMGELPLTPRDALVIALVSGSAVQLMDACRLVGPDPNDLDRAYALAQQAVAVAYENGGL